MRCSLASLPVVAALLLALPACGRSKPAVAPVSGRITLDGKPVTTGVVIFYPQTGRPATSQIGSDGRYTLGTFTPTDGALPGLHRVVIESRAAPASTPRPARPVGPPPPGTPDDIAQEWAAGTLSAIATETEWLVPEQYAAQSTTPLRATVSRGSNVIDFDLVTP
jgi:hypothetical protein